MRAQLVAALRILVGFTVLVGLAYPLVVTGAAQLAFGDKADGSLVDVDGDPVGSALLGQEFTSAGYFHSRPSAAGAAASGSTVEGDPADPEDLTVVASGASNLGPTNEELLVLVAERAAAYRETNGLAVDQPVPADAVTASGSGVDPHISLANARLQADRVAQERGLSVDEVQTLVDAHTDDRALGFLGEAGVNVLELNLALDRHGR